MASRSSIQFIDAALFTASSPFSLSYTDPDKKWLIREHLLSLLQDFPSLTPSIDTYFHNNGSSVNLFNVIGDLKISPSTPQVPVTIWLHENYPHMAPMVFVSSKSVPPIHRDHPFVDPSSGSTTSPYLQSWLYPRSNLYDLVKNLVKLFSHNHPFHDFTSSSLNHPSLASKREARDRLTCSLHYDMVALRAETDEEIEGLLVLQAEMAKRVDMATSTIIGLEHERMNLKNRVMDLTEEADVLVNWLRFNGGGVRGQVDDVFEGADEESRVVIDCLAEDRSVEDVIYALDKAVETGVVSIGMYIRQVRKLAREQFYQRALVVKLKGPQMLNWPN